MTRKILLLLFAIGLTISATQVESQLLTGTPNESTSPAKHRAQKKAETTPTVESTASPSTAESPAAISPTPRPVRRKTTAEISPSPTPTAVASPARRKFKLRFPRLFKPKMSPSPTP
ncbi:MAG TPA: hypothetical protein VFX07_14475 [Candidatus Udaeobacter sp.]|nr:hypothetical protein [Candidatus Udaeobacter sp.]